MLFSDYNGGAKVVFAMEGGVWPICTAELGKTTSQQHIAVWETDGVSFAFPSHHSFIHSYEKWGKLHHHRATRLAFQPTRIISTYNCQYIGFYWGDRQSKIIEERGLGGEFIHATVHVYSV